MMPFLKLEHVRNAVLNDVGLSVEAGECLGISGPSGAGKSRLLRAIADLDVHEGSIRLAGRDQAGFQPGEWRRRVGLLPAESRWWEAAVGDHFPADYSQTGSSELAALNLAADVMQWPVSRLSSGEKQRLALLRLLANRPEVLLLDEPTANLDGHNAGRMEALLRDYQAARPAAVLWVSHSPVQLQRVATRIFRLEQGRLYEAAP